MFLFADHAAGIYPLLISDRLLTKVNFYPQISSFLDLSKVPAPVGPAQPTVPAPDTPARAATPPVAEALPAQARIIPTQDARPRGTVRNGPSQRASRPQPRPQPRQQPLIQPMPAPDRRQTNPRPRSTLPLRSYAETTAQTRSPHGNANGQQRSHQASGSNEQSLGQRDRTRHAGSPLLLPARAEDRRRI